MTSGAMVSSVASVTAAPTARAARFRNLSARFFFFFFICLSVGDLRVVAAFKGLSAAAQWPEICSGGPVFAVIDSSGARPSHRTSEPLPSCTEFKNAYLNYNLLKKANRTRYRYLPESLF